MVKALTFKGDKKASKKRKRAADDEAPSDALTTKTTSADAAEEDENWVTADTLTDISGPVMLVLPTTSPVTCLATDAMGKVHASPVENMVEDAPQTAEPHLVSQVWIATRVVGSEGDFTFKGHHGRYLGCDKFGVFEAAREAMGTEETFRLEPAEREGMFDVRTGRGTFLSVDQDKSPLEVRGDAEEIGESSHVRVRMQARFKPKHKVEKAEKVRAKISRKELEDEVGRRLEDEEVKRLKKARREGNYHEAMLDVKVKGKHDKFA